MGKAARPESTYKSRNAVRERELNKEKKPSNLIPVEVMIMLKEGTSELSGRVVIGPVDPGSRTGEENIGLERWVKRRQHGKIRWVVRIFVPGMVGGTRFGPRSLLPVPHQDYSDR